MQQNHQPITSEPTVSQDTEHDHDSQANRPNDERTNASTTPPVPEDNHTLEENSDSSKDIDVDKDADDTTDSHANETSDSDVDEPIKATED